MVSLFWFFEYNMKCLSGLLFNTILPRSKKQKVRDLRIMEMQLSLGSEQIASMTQLSEQLNTLVQCLEFRCECFGPEFIGKSYGIHSMEEIEIFVISCRRILFYAVSRILNNPHYYHMMISIQTFSMPREGFCNLNVSSYY